MYIKRRNPHDTNNAGIGYIKYVLSYVFLVLSKIFISCLACYIENLYIYLKKKTTKRNEKCNEILSTKRKVVKCSQIINKRVTKFSVTLQIF